MPDANEQAVTTGPKSLMKRLVRPLMMGAVPLILVAIGAYYWLRDAIQVTTENAYVQQNKVSISADISGRVLRFNVRESQNVAKGDVLIEIDPEPFAITLAQQEAALASARLQVAQLVEASGGTGADLQGKIEAKDFAEIDLRRQAGLLDNGFTTQARFQQAQHALAQARSEVAAAHASAAQARSALGSGSIENHPLVAAAHAAVERARLDLRRTKIFAPVSGTASQTDKIQPGQMIISGVPTLSLMVDGKLWIEANFKETDLEKMRVGQKSRITLDAYPKTPLPGHVESIGAGTGSEFSILPAQNATGNWVKVVQRVPVRIAIDDARNLPLIAGLSAKVTVQLRQTE